jgi:hypothetical protein
VPRAGPGFDVAHPHFKMPLARLAASE